MKQASKATTKNINGFSMSRQFQQRLREGLFLLNLSVALFCFIALVTYQPSDPAWSSVGLSQDLANAGGKAGAWFADFALYMFGYVAYIFPFIFGYMGWVLYRHQVDDNLKSYSLLVLKWIGFILIIVSSTGLASLHLTQYEQYLPFTAGGILGNVVGFGLAGVLGQVGSTLCLSAVLLVSVTWGFGFSWMRFSRYLGELALYAIARQKQLFIKLKAWIISKKPKKLFSFSSKSLITSTKKALKKAPAKIKQTPVVPEVPIASEVVVEPSPPFSQPSAPKSIPVPERGAKKTKKDVVSFPALSKGKGSLPSLGLLEANHNPVAVQYSHEALEVRSREVEQRLLDFGVQAQVVAVHPGPVITRFELELAPGVKASKITGLARDLARSLSMISVRVVEIIPGKSVVGLELPNENRDIVNLRDVLDSKQYQQAHSPLSLALGKDIAGHPVVVDLAKMPHLLVAGTTGSGKSVGVNAMLLSILYKSTPDDVRLILVDPKMLELAIYEGIPHLLTPVVTDMKEAANALRWSVGEMERRYRLMASLGVRNIAGYNAKVAEAIKKGEPLLDPFAENVDGQDPKTLEKLPFIMIVVDEFADMMMVVGKKVEQLIARIAQKARAAGIHLILATQRPSVDVITGLIKANIPTRIAFQVSSKIDSRTIIDQQGAEQLLGYGDMLYLAPGTGVPTRVHGAFVADQEVHNVVSELKAQGEPLYLSEILEGGNFADSEGRGGFDDDESSEQDALYDDAVRFVTETRKASISSVQRRLKVGYNRAARLIEEMESSGVVTPMESNGSREVLAPPPPRD